MVWYTWYWHYISTDCLGQGLTFSRQFLLKCQVQAPILLTGCKFRDSHKPFRFDNLLEWLTELKKTDLLIRHKIFHLKQLNKATQNKAWGRAWTCMSSPGHRPQHIHVLSSSLYPCTLLLLFMEVGEVLLTGITKQWLSHWHSVSNSTLLIEVWSMVGIPQVHRHGLSCPWPPPSWHCAGIQQELTPPHKLWSGWKGSVTKNVRCCLELCHSGNFKDNGASEPEAVAKDRW